MNEIPKSMPRLVWLESILHIRIRHRERRIAQTEIKARRKFRADEHHEENDRQPCQPATPAALARQRLNFGIWRIGQARISFRGMLRVKLYADRAAKQKSRP